jgi:hypothetical protein
LRSLTRKSPHILGHDAPSRTAPWDSLEVNTQLHGQPPRGWRGWHWVPIGLCCHRLLGPTLYCRRRLCWLPLWLL